VAPRKSAILQDKDQESGGVANSFGCHTDARGLMTAPAEYPRNGGLGSANENPPPWRKPLTVALDPGKAHRPGEAGGTAIRAAAVAGGHPAETAAPKAAWPATSSSGCVSDPVAELLGARKGHDRTNARMFTSAFSGRRRAL
jgi:hypothetical protein